MQELEDGLSHWGRLGEKPRLMTHKGAVSGQVYIRFVRNRLVPWLRPGDVVVMDNLNMHKLKAVQDAISAARAFTDYLPTYSPELNPIELLWADLTNAVGSPRAVVKNETRTRPQTSRIRKRHGCARQSLTHEEEE
jgi:transposase